MKAFFLILVVGLVGSLSSSCDKGEIQLDLERSLTPEPKPQQDTTSVVIEDWEGDTTQTIIVEDF